MFILLSLSLYGSLWWGWVSPWSHLSLLLRLFFYEGLSPLGVGLCPLSSPLASSIVSLFSFMRGCHSAPFSSYRFLFSLMRSLFFYEVGLDLAIIYWFHYSTKRHNTLLAEAPFYHKMPSTIAYKTSPLLLFTQSPTDRCYLFGSYLTENVSLPI